MKKKTKITRAATTTLRVLSLAIIAPETMSEEWPKQPEACFVSALVDGSRSNAPTPTMQTVINPPVQTSAEPEIGDVRIIDGKKQSYFLGFSRVEVMGENE